MAAQKIQPQSDFQTCQQRGLGYFFNQIDWKTKVRRTVKEWLVTLPVIKQMVQKKFDEGIAEMEVELEKDIEKNRDPHKSRKLPEEGMKKENLESRIHKWVEVE